MTNRSPLPPHLVAEKTKGQKKKKKISNKNEKNQQIKNLFRSIFSHFLSNEMDPNKKR